MACSDSDRSSWPTAPSSVPSVSSGARIERWTLTLKIREVLGTECSPDLGASRQVDLRVEFADDGTVVMRYVQQHRGFADGATVSGWTLERGFEGSGRAYEGLPCSGAALERDGAPTTLTGYFSDDGLTFSGIEVRRYLDRPQGDIVYHLEWDAQRVNN